MELTTPAFAYSADAFAYVDSTSEGNDVGHNKDFNCTGEELHLIECIHTQCSGSGLNVGSGSVVDSQSPSQLLCSNYAEVVCQGLLYIIHNAILCAF